MQILMAVFLNSVISLLQNSISTLSPVALEVIKVVLVSFAWIGGLCWFMIRKDRRRQEANA